MTPESSHSHLPTMHVPYKNKQRQKNQAIGPIHNVFEERCMLTLYGGSYELLCVRQELNKIVNINVNLSNRMRVATCHYTYVR